MPSSSQLLEVKNARHGLNIYWTPFTFRPSGLLHRRHIIGHLIQQKQGLVDIPGWQTHLHEPHFQRLVQIYLNDKLKLPGLFLFIVNPLLSKWNQSWLYLLLSSRKSNYRTHQLHRYISLVLIWKWPSPRQTGRTSTDDTYLYIAT